MSIQNVTSIQTPAKPYPECDFVFGDNGRGCQGSAGAVHTAYIVHVCQDLLTFAACVFKIHDLWAVANASSRAKLFLNNVLSPLLGALLCFYKLGTNQHVGHDVSVTFLYALRGAAWNYTTAQYLDKVLHKLYSGG